MQNRSEQSYKRKQIKSQQNGDMSEDINISETAAIEENQQKIEKGACEAQTELEPIQTGPGSLSQ